ncbi:MAG TPA: SPOR domain-containing protein [Thermoanaerobaculia bacterium]|nr:SPOR domain-containing protein [Thermoanaerobaculia bacterium]
MVSEQEPSYYEIALTNRQVLVAFVILLVCVLASFFAGVWVGRGSPAAAADGAQQAAAQPTPTTQPEELAFFNDGEASSGTAGDRPDLQDLARNPRQGTTLAEDLGVKDAPRAGASPAPAAPGGEPEGEPGPGAEPSGAPAATGTAAPTTPAAPAGSLFIQVFSSRDELQARRLETRMRAAGFKAFLSPAGPMFRVRVGPFAARPEAEQQAAKARREFRVDTWITASP